MAKDYQALAASVIEKVGGKDNITSVTHCVTRLRFVLKDVSHAREARDAALRAISAYTRVDAAELLHDDGADD